MRKSPTPTPPPTPSNDRKTSMISCELPVELLEGVESHRKMLHCSKSDIVRWALYDYLDKYMEVGHPKKVQRHG